MGNAIVDSATRALRFAPEITGLTLVSLQATEAVSALPRYSLRAEITDAASFDFSSLPGQGVTVAWSPDDHCAHERTFSGYVVDVEDCDSGGSSYAAIAIEVRPWPWLLTLNTQSRIFQGVTITDVIADVIAALKSQMNVSFAYDVTGVGSDHPQRNYCVQYNESDYDFLCRLLEDEGVYYYFANNGTLYFADHSTLSSAAAGFTATAAVNATNGPIRTWKRKQQFKAGAFQSRDFSFQASDTTFAAEQSLPVSVTVDAAAVSLSFQSQLKNREAPAGFAKFVDGIPSSITSEAAGNTPVSTTLASIASKRALVRGQELASDAYCVQGTGSFAFLFPGYSFTRSVTASTTQGDYFVTSVVHAIDTSAAQTSNGQSAVVPYCNTFECIPLSLPFRPRRQTAKPRIAGTQTARVVGPANTEVWTDARGRILVEFYWSKASVSELTLSDVFVASQCSAWVRIAQSSAGNNWGGQTIPRVGQEVVVAFENGDPDMPVVLGSVYNDKHAPAFPVPQFSLSSGVKTHTPGGDATQFSGLRFDDTAGKELTQLRSQNDMLLDAKNNFVAAAAQKYDVYVGTSQTNIVGGGRGFPLMETTYQPLAEFSADFPPNWDPVKVNAGNAAKVNAVFGNEYDMNGSFYLRSTGQRHDCSGATLSFLTLFDLLPTQLAVVARTFGTIWRSIGQGLGKLELNAGPTSVFTQGCSLANYRGGRYELTGSFEESLFPAGAVVAKIGWILYGLASATLPSLLIGLMPNKADEISNICAYISRGLAFIVLNAEHFIGCAISAERWSTTAKNLGKQGLDELRDQNDNAIDTFGHSVVKAFKALEQLANVLDAGNHFQESTGGWYVSSGKDIGIHAEEGLSIESQNAVVISDSISLRAGSTRLLLGGAVGTTPALLTGDGWGIGVGTLLPAPAPPGLGIWFGGGCIRIDALGNITLLGTTINLQTPAAMMTLGPKGIESSAPIVSNLALLQKKDQAPMQAKQV